jgi:hypothetical protein
MTTLETVLAVFGGNAILIAVLGFFIKSLISQLLAKDFKLFETKLLQTAAVAAEELKHRLSLFAHERNVRFSRLHEKQSEVLEEIYAKLLDFEDASAALTLASNETPENLLEFALRRAEDSGSELAHYIRKREIYLPAALSAQLHDLLNRVTTLLSNCSFNLLSKKLAGDGRPELFPETREEWTAVHQYLEHEAPEVRRALESDFRRRLGAEAAQ